MSQTVQVPILSRDLGLKQVDGNPMDLGFRALPLGFRASRGDTGLPVAGQYSPK